MKSRRRDWFRLCASAWLGSNLARARGSATRAEAKADSALRIKALKITPIALPDPPLLHAGGCHGPYFLRNVVELETDEGIVGLGEAPGGRARTEALKRAAKRVVGRSAFAYRSFASDLMKLGMGCYAGIETACLDACGKATNRRVCDLLGGPARDSVEFAAYLFYRYAADNPIVLADPHLVDRRGKGARALDLWGEIRTPQALVEEATAFRDRWGFRVFKLKAGVLSPELERDSLVALASNLGPEALLRIDPNGRWKVETAIRIGKDLKKLPMEYYEDPVLGQTAMAEVRRASGLKTGTNMCVTRFADLAEALRLRPIDYLLADHHYFGGFAGCLALGPVCEAAGWTLSQHSNNHSGLSMAAMIHLAATIPQLTAASDTHYPWLADDADILDGPKLPIRNGQMSIPPGPGLGVRLDPDKVARAHETYVKSGMLGRDDAPLMRRLDPTWTGGLL